MKYTFPILIIILLRTFRHHCIAEISFKANVRRVALACKFSCVHCLTIQREQSHQESKATFSHEAFTRSCLDYEFGG
ncbi:hypothetical protein T06_16131 [Trichinella sp. T6]|nr:hypothetical protein T06_16131 [Trichinella sp. T6]